MGQPCVLTFGDTFVGTSLGVTDPGPLPTKGSPHDHRNRNPYPPNPRLSAERRARQDELLAQLADGVQTLTTSDGWRRYLRAMRTLRTYSTGNSGISQTREYACYRFLAADRPAR